MLVAAVFGLTLPVSAVRAQDVYDFNAALAAAAEQLATELGADVTTVVPLRRSVGTWNDACLGAAEAGELCAQVLTDGFVLWFTVNRGIDAYRAHTNGDGTAVRIAMGPLTADQAKSEPLFPAGAQDRAPKPAPIHRQRRPRQNCGRQGRRFGLGLERRRCRERRCECPRSGLHILAVLPPLWRLNPSPAPQVL